MSYPKGMLMFRPSERLSKKQLLKWEPLVHIHKDFTLGVRLARTQGAAFLGVGVGG